MQGSTGQAARQDRSEQLRTAIAGLDAQRSAWAVVEAGHQALMDVAATKHLPEFRKAFLENVPDHRSLLEMWERGRPSA